MHRVGLAISVVLAAEATAQVVAPRSFFSMPSSNGYGAVMVDARVAKVVHFRERLAATEEPQLDAAGQEVWQGNQPLMVHTRDLLFDAFFGLRAAGQQRWLTMAPSESGYLTAPPSPRSGSGIVTWKQPSVLGLEVATSVFAPRALGRASFVMILAVRNAGSSTVSGVSAFSIHNFHLGNGRPGVRQELDSNGETVAVASNRDLLERAFAGVVVARPLAPPSRVSAWHAASPATENAFRLVEQGGVADLVDRSGDLGVANDWATAFQFDVGDVHPGETKWVGVAFAHHGDPMAGAQTQDWLTAYTRGRSAQTLLEEERALWSSFQRGLTLPTGLTRDEEAALRQSAVILAMAQVQEREAFLREHLTRDGELRRSRFPSADGGALLPGWVPHRGRGALLASLPPGEWTTTWTRDAAYAAAAMAVLGLGPQAKDALRFTLDAEAGRFQNWTELQPYGMPPYSVSLARYTGFGVEETDFNAFGPNLEFDGLGLFLSALRTYEERTGDTSISDERWNDLTTKIANPLLALIDPATGLMRKDSSIWETHWKGRERAWTFTNIATVRGLCDAAAMAQRRGDTARSGAYRSTALALRESMAVLLTDSRGALASNREELVSGRGYADAAVLEALALGLFDPGERIGRATVAAIETRLRTAAGAGWARNDDRMDHPTGVDLSPWGSEYDSAEWVFTDLRGAVALRAAGQFARADAILNWVTANATANADVIPETFDENSGAWKFNAPMVGFGAGVYALALAQRAEGPPPPACGAFLNEANIDAGFDAGFDGGSTGGGGSDAGVRPTPPPPSCGCGSPSSTAGVLALGLTLAWSMRRRGRRLSR